MAELQWTSTDPVSGRREEGGERGGEGGGEGGDKGGGSCPDLSEAWTTMTRRPPEARPRRINTGLRVQSAAHRLSC